VAVARTPSRDERLRLAAWARKIPVCQWLGAILLLQGGVSLIALRNSVSQDEALYLTAGRQIANHLLRGGATPDSYAGRFSGLPYLYPPIAGALDAVGGLELARLLSLLAMLCTTIAVYIVGHSLYDQRSGVAAAAIFAVQAPTLLIGRLATYDAACLLLLAIATILALRAGSAPTGHLAALVPVPLVLAVATKYVGELLSRRSLPSWRCRHGASTVGARRSGVRRRCSRWLACCCASAYCS
jgi:4-amino-4-deoxy-L-arabinose transferase-like glycosyltransferase